MQKRHLIILFFFIGLLVVLTPYYFLQTRTVIPTFISPAVTRLAQLLELQSEVATNLVSTADPLVASTVLKQVQEYRERYGYTTLEDNSDLTKVAQQLADAIFANVENYDDMPFETLIASYAHDSKTPLAAISHVSVVGPTSSQVAFAAFVGDSAQTEILLDDEAEIIAVATNSAVTVITLARVAPKNEPQAIVPQKQVFPEISDTAMTTALNEYRRAHGIPQLIENPLLCQYAQKRVGDLVAFGGLDGHAGFQKDFSDLNNLPEVIQQYPGGRIGENLAYQHCRNMTTGDGFVAETATALIEWCFDSSTKGHREAQLNPKFTATCTRHQDGLFVVIFGE
ncbi:MAG: CAP domain-containing protein [Candidatus Pacebacteria bacterium]|nr:CAP domain-containing protein [Candidatus Paceibacterota bacterium]PIR60636.1 MAG: hypothetical protein COU68_02415 [Candidatus Pacebacteria bacterium CG10_big_fil_rev_8_21_14_0_10_45_6]